jgi:hypothetical protein
MIRRVPQPACGLLQDALSRIPVTSLATLNRSLDQLLETMQPSAPKPLKKPLAETLP